MSDRMVCNASAPMVASVNTKESMVAMSGTIMPNLGDARDGDLSFPIRAVCGAPWETCRSS